MKGKEKPIALILIVFLFATGWIVSVFQVNAYQFPEVLQPISEETTGLSEKRIPAGEDPYAYGEIFVINNPDGQNRPSDNPKTESLCRVKLFLWRCFSFLLNWFYNTKANRDEWSEGYEKEKSMVLVNDYNINNLYLMEVIFYYASGIWHCIPGSWNRTIFRRVYQRVRSSHSLYLYEQRK